MRYTVNVKAVDIHGGLITESSIPMVDLGTIQDILDEFIDRLERRGVAFYRVLTDMVVQRPVADVMAERGLYRGLFPELAELLA